MTGNGIRYEKTAVGDKYVCENMMANGHSLGGEQSGHIIFSKHATTGDGILTSLMLMEVIIEKKQLLNTLASEVSIYPQLLENVRVANKTAARNNEEVKKAVASVEKELGEDGRILVRESGTEPVIRVMVEAKKDAICREMVQRVIEVMDKRGTDFVMRKEVLAVGCALMVFCGCGKNNAAQHYESGWAAMEKKDYTTAVNEFQQVIDQNSRLAESYRAEGIAYYSEKAYPEAIAAFSEKSEQYG